MSVAGAGPGMSYGALGLPLAFAALPLYVQLPSHYAQHYGMPLAWLGALLLLVRAADALVDPWLGLRLDTAFARGRVWLLRALQGAAVLLALGLLAAYRPVVAQLPSLLLWCGLSLMLTYLAYSVLSIAHQSWGARLAGGDAAQARWVAWREGAALLGVILASVMPGWIGIDASLGVFALALLAATLALRCAPWPESAAPASIAEMPAPAVWRSTRFRRLLLVFMLNGVAAAVPATLVLFFVRDRLQAPAWEGAFLAIYFVSAALSLPLWVQGVRRLGLERAWALGMVLAVLGFGATFMLQSGDVAAFALICLVSGAALGIDLVAPGALLSRVIHDDGHAGAAGAYFGWWNSASKLNLALAAGLALPALGWAGYQPGRADEAGLRALALAYGLVPCGLKLLALLALWRWMQGQRARGVVR
jgi:GPH family glycoside/pentoside/hexuronide:cation symporter